jgi:putative oxidoreductase
MRKIAEKLLNILSALAFLAPLLTRLVIGWAFHVTGHGKLEHLDRTASFFSDSGIPFAHANAVFVSSLELVGGLFLILGLGTRLFAFLLSGSMVVAMLTADRATFIEKFPGDLTDVVSFVYFLFLVWLVLYGPGPVSIDHWIAKKLGIREPDRTSG